MCVFVSSCLAYVHRFPWRTQNTIDPLELECYRQVWTSLHGYWDLNSGALEEQQTLLTLSHLSRPLFAFWDRVLLCSPGWPHTQPPECWAYKHMPWLHLQVHFLIEIFFKVQRWWHVGGAPWLPPSSLSSVTPLLADWAVSQEPQSQLVLLWCTSEHREEHAKDLKTA